MVLMQDMSPGEVYRGSVTTPASPADGPMALPPTPGDACQGLIAPPSPICHGPMASPSPMIHVAPPSPMHHTQQSPVAMMGSALAAAAATTCAAVKAGIFPAVEDFVLVRMGQDVLPACLIQHDGTMVTVRPLQAYRARNAPRILKWRKNPLGARANCVIHACEIVSGAFQLKEGTIPAHIDSMVTTELGAPEAFKENRRPEPAKVPEMPLIPEMSGSSSFSQMPSISETNKTSDVLFKAQAPKGEFQFGKEVKELRNLGFNQEFRLRDVLSSNHGNVERSLQQLNARRRFKYPTAFAELKQMGFSNDEMIKALLMKHRGNKEAVVFEMLG